MRGPGSFALLALVALLWGAPDIARGDAGTVRLHEVAGTLRLTLFTSPSPLRAGPVDLGVMVQDAASGEPLLDAEVALVLRREGADRAPIALTASRESAANKLIHHAAAALPEAGVWRIELRVARGTERATASCRVEAGAPRSPVPAFWPWLALPPLAVALFALHQHLRRRGARVSLSS